MRHIQTFSAIALGATLLATTSHLASAQSVVGTRVTNLTKPTEGVSNLRILNPLNIDGKAEVDLINPTTGAVLATWKTNIPAHASPQRSLTDIETAAVWVAGAVKQAAYTVAVRTNFPGSVQHVAIRSGNFVDLTSCNARKFSSSYAPLANVHAGTTNLYPSYFYITNKTGAPAADRFVVYDAATGARLGEWSTPNLPLGSQIMFISYGVTAVLGTKYANQPQLNLLRANASPNTVRHVVFNPRTSVMAEMNAACFTTIANTIDSSAVASVPSGVGIDAFYKKYLNAGGLPVVASAAVSDVGLARTRDLVLRMTRQRPDVLLNMIEKNAYVGIVGTGEAASGQPGFASVAATTRSVGVSTAGVRATLAAEENLYAWPTDAADLGNEAFVREFARSMLTQGITGLDTTFDAALTSAYTAAAASPLYAGTSARANVASYWAESVEAFFNAKRLVTSANVLKHEIRSRAELQSYDPAMYTLVQQTFGDDALPAFTNAPLPPVVAAPATSVPPPSEPSTAALELLASVITPKATTEQARLCTGSAFPAQWEWDPAKSTQQVAPATTGTPKIEQVRNGTVIATYKYLGSGAASCSIPENAATNPASIPSTCGPFGRTHTWRTWQPGDVFLVYPAVYSGVENQPWIGPIALNYAAYSAGTFDVPTGITIRGVTVGGVRPVIKVAAAGDTTLGQSAVYLDRSKDVVIQNIDIDAEEVTSVGKSLVYVHGAQNLTLRDMRIHGAARVRANGVFGTPSNSGTLKLERVELYNNGGSSGPAHNIYVNESSTDPNFTLEFVNSWSHASTYGHLLKSRAQITRVIGSYLSGGVPGGAVDQAEPYLIDVPNGGRLLLQNSILVKNASGVDSNGIMVAYGMEAMPSTWTHSVTIQNNTFVAFAKYFDGSHPIYPMNFFYPAKMPGTATFPAIVPTSIKRNVFAGLCNTGFTTADYRGEQALTIALEELNKDYSLKNKYVGNDPAIVGTTSYEHVSQAGVRASKTIGGRD